MQNIFGMAMRYPGGFEKLYDDYNMDDWFGRRRMVQLATPIRRVNF